MRAATLWSCGTRCRRSGCWTAAGQYSSRSRTLIAYHAATSPNAPRTGAACVCAEPLGLLFLWCPACGALCRPQWGMASAVINSDVQQNPVTNPAMVVTVGPFEVGVRTMLLGVQGGCWADCLEGPQTRPERRAAHLQAPLEPRGSAASDW